jgi:hypothetical protein
MNKSPVNVFAKIKSNCAHAERSIMSTKQKFRLKSTEWLGCRLTLPDAQEDLQTWTKLIQKVPSRQSEHCAAARPELIECFGEGQVERYTRLDRLLG